MVTEYLRADLAGFYIFADLTDRFWKNPSAALAAEIRLQRREAQHRAALLRVEEYDVTLDLASSEETFGSLTRITLVSQAGETFLDLTPASVRSIHLDGDPIDGDTLRGGRLPLSLTEGRHELVVDAVMPFRNDGEGLHRSVDPADGRHYVYGMSFMDAAPSIFACFDQPDLKAPYTFHVRAPEDWVVVGNAPGTNPEPGVWELERSQPLSTYFVTLVAGPYHLVRDTHDGIALGLSARQSIASDLERDADELFTMTKQCFDEMHRLFDIRYPFGDYHQAFVPEFNAGAMENPGCVTFRDPLVFTSKVTRAVRIQRATTVAHEMAHQWFGNITTPLWWDDLWLNESFAEYIGVRVTADVTEYDDAWVQNSFARRQWGLVADQRPSTHPVAGNGEEDALAALQNFDGISYAKGSSILKQLAARLGDEVFLAGVREGPWNPREGNQKAVGQFFGGWDGEQWNDVGTVVGAPGAHGELSVVVGQVKANFGADPFTLIDNAFAWLGVQGAQVLCTEADAGTSWVNYLYTPPGAGTYTVCLTSVDATNEATPRYRAALSTYAGNEAACATAGFLPLVEYAWNGAAITAQTPVLLKRYRGVQSHRMLGGEDLYLTGSATDGGALIVGSDNDSKGAILDYLLEDWDAVGVSKIAFERLYRLVGGQGVHVLKIAAQIGVSANGIRSVGRAHRIAVELYKTYYGQDVPGEKTISQESLA